MMNDPAVASRDSSGFSTASSAARNRQIGEAEQNMPVRFVFAG